MSIRLGLLSVALLVPSLGCDTDVLLLDGREGLGGGTEEADDDDVTDDDDAYEETPTPFVPLERRSITLHDADLKVFESPQGRAFGGPLFEDFSGDGVVDVVARGSGSFLTSWRGPLFGELTLDDSWSRQGVNLVKQGTSIVALNHDADPAMELAYLNPDLGVQVVGDVGTWAVFAAFPQFDGLLMLDAANGGDTDGDGLDEPMTLSFSGPRSTLDVWPGSTGGARLPVAELGAMPTPNIWGTPDIDGDGVRDVVLRGSANGVLGVEMFTGPFTGPLALATPDAWSEGDLPFFAMDDFDQDGIADLFMQDGPDRLALVRGPLSGPIRAADADVFIDTTGFVQDGIGRFRIFPAGDFDGDGTPDGVVADRLAEDGRGTLWVHLNLFAPGEHTIEPEDAILTITGTRPDCDDDQGEFVYGNRILARPHPPRDLDGDGATELLFGVYAYNPVDECRAGPGAVLGFFARSP